MYHLLAPSGPFETPLHHCNPHARPYASVHAITSHCVLIVSCMFKPRSTPGRKEEGRTREGLLRNPYRCTPTEESRQTISICFPISVLVEVPPRARNSDEL